MKYMLKTISIVLCHILVITSIPADLYALRPIATGAPDTIATSRKTDGIDEPVDIADDYDLIEYSNKNFYLVANENGIKKVTTKKILKVAAAIIIFIGLFILANSIIGSVFGTSLLGLYAQLYAADRFILAFIVSGVTAAITGAVAELTGLYISDNPSRRHRIISRFVSIILFRLLILGPTAYITDLALENFMPKTTATPFFLTARVAISMTHGIIMSSLVQIFLPHYYQRSYAKELKEMGQTKEADELLKEYRIWSQIKKTINSIWARLPFVFVQHDIIQTIFAHQPSAKILSRFGVGFLMGLFRSWVANRKKASLSVKVFACSGILVSLISFLWGNAWIGYAVVSTSGLIYIFSKLRVKTNSEKLCMLLNSAGVFLQGNEFSHIRVVEGLSTNAGVIAEPDNKVSILLNKGYIETLLETKGRQSAISSLREMLYDIVFTSEEISRAQRLQAGRASEAIPTTTEFEIKGRLKIKKDDEGFANEGPSKSSSAGTAITLPSFDSERKASRVIDFAA